MTSTPISLFCAARTRYQQEQHVCERLSELETEYYAPFRIDQRQWGGRVKTIEEPLIPSLVFLCATYEGANSLLSHSRLLIRYMQAFATNERLVVPNQQTDQFKEMSQLHMTLFNKLKPGCRFRVLERAFKGFEGELIRVKGHKRVGRLEILFALATTYIPGQYLEPIE